MATTRIRSEPPLVVIVGPTASGKTALAITVAKESGGEIISADSRTIYKHLSIGTAKPSVGEQALVPHWGIDLVHPGERFTAADFQKYAYKKIAEIRARGHVPILVGGTGLYVDAVLYNFQFPEHANHVDRRDQLLQLSLDQLHEYCNKNNIKLPENKMNKRYVVNAILRDGTDSKRETTPIENSIVVGIATENETLRKRITERAGAIVSDQTLKEAMAASERYGWDNEAMTGNIYPLIKQFFEGTLSKEQLLERSVAKDWQLAKRQKLWFRRNEHIHWGSSEELHTYIIRKLAELNNS